MTIWWVVIIIIIIIITTTVVGMILIDNDSSCKSSNNNNSKKNNDDNNNVLVVKRDHRACNPNMPRPMDWVAVKAFKLTACYGYIVKKGFHFIVIWVKFTLNPKP